LDPQSKSLTIPPSPLLCPRCRGSLAETPAGLSCGGCVLAFPIEDGIADLSGGRYYDAFDPETVAPEVLLSGLELETSGVRRRIRDFYAPLLRAAESKVSRALDCGCGNGLSVDLLIEEGFDAWGIDVSQLRKWQWRERRRRDRLVVTDGSGLPFPDGYFCAVISSGVIEHVGVDEVPPPNYGVRPRPDRDAARLAFVAELLRVTRPGGVVYVDCPNGAFPIDFWHGNAPGAARRHSRAEGFLPHFGELRSLAGKASPRARVQAISPYRRLQFHQAKGHLHGRLLSAPANLFLWLIRLPVLRYLARTGANPFLVVRITRAS
jgi:SAM-dependent methyltransferase